MAHARRIAALERQRVEADFVTNRRLTACEDKLSRLAHLGRPPWRTTDGPHEPFAISEGD